MIKKVIAILMSAGIIITSLSGCSIDKTILGNDVTSSSIEYENKIFDNSYVHEINIKISKDDLEDLLENPLDKTNYKIDVTIDGETCKDVSFKTKGNTSLSEVASDEDSDRYSYKINFGKYVKNQNYYGLDKLSLNNIMSDATYMKDYLSYKIMRETGVSAPLTSYVSLSINGEKKGLYLAVEDINESFLKRNYGSDSDGELYKPETEMLNNAGKMKVPDNGGDNDDDKGQMTPPDGNDKDNNRQMTPPDGNSKDNNGQITPPDGNDKDNNGQMTPPDINNNDNKGPGGFGNSNNGASLSYTDDDFDSYSDIFDNAETEITDEDKERLIESLKKLNDGSSDLSDCLDVDEVIKYFVAHNFVDNYDSYTGNMLHNYFLYEKNGIISILPWDYNLAFGAFGDMGKMMNFSENGDASSNKSQEENENSKKQTNSATSMVNYPIDTPLSGASEDDRPLWKAIIQNDSYKELYHKYFDELLTNYFESGDFEKDIDDTYNMIRSYVENDSSAFYTVSEFDKAYETLKSFCNLRAESIRKQLNGQIQSTTDGQNADKSNLVNADNININDMGTQGGKKGKDGEEKGFLEDKSNKKFPNDKNNKEMNENKN